MTKFPCPDDTVFRKAIKYDFNLFIQLTIKMAFGNCLALNLTPWFLAFVDIVWHLPRHRPYLA
jgi:hypothetical protein